jgi:hypothetical protein
MTATGFHLEPWGDFWPMPAGATYDLHFEINGDTPQNLPDVLLSDDAITVFAGMDGDLTVYENGREINSSILRESAETYLLKHAA